MYAAPRNYQDVARPLHNHQLGASRQPLPPPRLDPTPQPPRKLCARFTYVRFLFFPAPVVA